MYLVDNDLNSKDPCRKSSSMSPQHWLPRLPKRHRRKALVCLIGCLCFLLGLAVPFLFGKGLGGTRGSLRSRKSSSNVNVDDFKLDGVLSDLFISVKTTKKYHHPRLVILLETWVTLVKSQAGDFAANLLLPYNQPIIVYFRLGSSPTVKTPKCRGRPTVI